MLTSRVKELRDRSFRIEGRFWERELLWTEMVRKHHCLPAPLRTAKAFRHLTENVSLHVRPGELIVGAVPIAPVPSDREDALRDCAEFNAQHSMHETFVALLSDEERVGLDTLTYTAGSMTGHTTINNEKVLSRGLLDLRREAQERRAALSLTDATAIGKRTFYEAVIEALAGALAFAERYAEYAAALASTEPNAARAAELREIARICKKVPAHPAESLHEALQATWFMHQLVAMETGEGHACFCPGRADLYAYEFLARDLETGRLDRRQALELLECFFLRYADWGRYASPQILIVGGQRPDGSDASNDLTDLCLEASRELAILNPALALSYHKATPDALLAKSCEVLRNGKGFPFIFNDEVIVPGLEDLGVAREDAVNYVPCACVEITVAGKSCPWVASGYHNWGKMIELALHDGVDPATGKQVGPHTGQFLDMASFDDFKKAMKEQVHYFVEMEVRSYNLLDKIMGEQMPLPLLSAVVDDCLEKGQDYHSGGARYNFIEPEAVGPANVADSLIAVKRLVFEEKRLDRKELLIGLACNFEGFEELRQALLHGAPKFGNDDDEVDALLTEFVDFWCTEVSKHRNYRGGPYVPGFLCWIMHGVLGQVVGALPDGRKGGEALASHLGPAQGRDRKGPTAMINSVAKADIRRALGGVVLNMKFMPKELETTAGVEKLSSLIRTMFDKGLFQVQLNLVDRETLLAAQREPARYADLTVRVGGYSAYFTSLDQGLQNEIIERTELTL